MKKLFALLAVVLAVVSCQKDVDNLDVNMGGDVATISVVLPEDAMTRAGYTDSAQSGLANTDGETIRVVMRIYDENGRESDNRYVDFLSGDERTANFDVRLVPNRQYTFVAWADQVEGEVDVDKYFDTFDDLADLAKVTFINGTWTEMNENRDAYTATHTEANFTSASNITLTLTRPFAKLRVVTTDMVDLKKLGIVPPFYATMSYTEPVPTSFNAISGTIGDIYDSEAKVFSKFVIKDYASNTTTNKTLFTDYVLIPESNVVKFTLDVYQDAACTKLIKSNAFTTDIPVKRNNLTTIQGNILTDGDKINVVIDPNFDNGTNWNPEADDKDIQTISSDKEFLAALNTAGQYIVVSDLHIAKAGDTITTRATGATGATAEGKVTTINLNGKTITVTNKTTDPFATVAAGNTLFLEGGNIVLTEDSTASFIKNEGNVVLSNGTLENESDDNTAAVVEGKVIVEENATVTDKNTTKVENWLTDVLANGGTYVFTEDMTSSEKIVVTAEAPVVLDGNGKTLTYTGSGASARAIDCSDNNVNVAISNLNIVCTASYCQRGINFNNAGTLTLNNVKVSGTNVTYALNLPGSSDNARVVITNSYLRGNIALNVWGENMTINATDSEFVSHDDKEVENYSAIVLNNDGTTIADGTVVTIEGGKIIALDENGEESYAIRNSTNSGTVTVSESTEVIGILSEPVAIVTYAGYDQFYSFTTLQRAINKAAENSNATVKLIKDITLDEPVMVAENQTIVLDLNGKKITTTLESEGRHLYAFENHGSLTIEDSNGNGEIVARGNYNYGTMTLESGTINACDGNGGYGVRNYAGTFVMNGGAIITSLEDDNKVNNGGSDATTLRIDEGATATINGGTINNICDYTFAIDNAGEITINGGTITSIHSTVSTGGDITINGGSFTCNGINGITAHVLWVPSGTATITGGTFDGKDNYNGFNVNAYQGAKVSISGGKFLSVHSGSLYGEGTISVTGGEFFDNPSARVAEGYKAIQNKGGSWSVIDSTVAMIGETKYETLNDAVAAVEDGGTITLVADEVFTKENYTLNSGSWYDGLYYVGDKSFTIDLGGKTISQDGAVNDYLLNFKNDGAKANTITLKNGTVDAGTAAFCALCTSSSNKSKITINLEKVNLVGNNSNGAVAKIRGGAELNVKSGTVITGKNNYVGIEAVGNNTVVNIYDNVNIYQNGTGSNVGAIVGASYNATMNIYGGYGKSAKCGIIVMSTGATINVSGGEWIANNDGTVAAGNNGVLVSQNNRYETGWACKSILNVTGGTFKGGYNCYGMGPGVEPDDAQINIKGGNFNANPASYVVENYEAIDNGNGTYSVEVAE